MQGTRRHANARNVLARLECGVGQQNAACVWSGLCCAYHYGAPANTYANSEPQSRSSHASTGRTPRRRQMWNSTRMDEFRVDLKALPDFHGKRIVCPNSIHSVGV